MLPTLLERITFTLSHLYPSGNVPYHSVMNLTRIRYFLMLCEHLHFTNTAKALGISQPALTKSIYQLEEELSTRLIRREGKHTHLTQQGELVYSKYKILVQTIDETEIEIAQALNKQPVQIKIAILRGINFKQFVPFLKLYHALHPDVQFSIEDCSEQKCLDLLLHGNVDCVLSTQPHSKEGQTTRVAIYRDSVRPFSTSNTMHINTRPSTLNFDIGTPEVLYDVGQSVYKDNAIGSQLVARASQELWVRQLTEAGLGVAAFAQDGSVNAQTSNNDEAHFRSRQIYAFLPIGRRDNDSYSGFIELIQKFDWDLPRNEVTA